MVKDAIPFLLILSIVAIAAFFFGWWPVGLIAVLGALFVANFFRNPERHPAAEQGLVSPADGRIVVVGDVEPEGRPPHCDDLPFCISIFMNVFDVHVNRSPAAGTIARIEHRGGLKLPADRDRARLENEQNIVRLETADGPLAFVQVAGLVARRIVFWRSEDQPVERGERVGLIKFGSRVDVYLPAGWNSLVKPGDRVRAGETIIAERTGEQ